VLCVCWTALVVDLGVIGTSFEAAAGVGRDADVTMMVHALLNLVNIL